MLLYNAEWWYDHGMSVNYGGKKFHNIGTWGQCYKTNTAVNHGSNKTLLFLGLKYCSNLLKF